jgi:hypothetical protein
MSKLEELYREAADKSTVEQQYDPPYLSEDLFIDEAKEITTNIAIKFADWIEKNRYVKFDIFENQISSTHYKYERWDKSYKISFEIVESETKTTQELFEEFLKTL